MLRAAALLARRGRQAEAAVNASRVLARGFAAPSEATAESCAPPIPVHGIAGRYASALYTAACKAGKLNAVEKDLTEIANLYSDSDLFHQFLIDPSVPKKEKLAGLDAILKKLSVSDLTQNFIGVLVENNRVSHFDRIAHTFDELLAAAKGEVRATITTAEPLSEEETEEIKSGLTGMLTQGQTLLVQQKVDPGIIGGLVIDIGDKHLDMSINSRIKKIQQLILETV
ncbi:hypothetical protein WJX72_002002 [[Myrmecia] bisecta]|uniref:ATP synthase subunit O, mitochondrial n=1 Tax=[Myrmecia] bisecta TaxID=41462 RepID=A0AAW1R5I7_9CHLO